MTTYTQRQQLEQQAQQLAKKRAFWLAIENACLLAAGIVSLVLLFAVYKGI
jgi:hypothetical protein